MRGVLAVSVLLFLSSCSTVSNGEQTESQFIELIPANHGIGFVNHLQFTPEINIIEYLYFNNGGGVAIGDIDNDGLEDIYLTANQKADKLYRNLGDMKFEDISEVSGILPLDNWSTGVTIDDINGDGWNDIYVCKVAPVSLIPTHNELYINQRDGTFQELSIDYGLDFSGYSTQASFFDYDLDGDLDVYLLNHSVHSTRSYGNISLRKERSEISGDRIYENRLNEVEGKFIDVTGSSGIFSSAIGYGLGVITTDLNADGFIDIYVGNDFHENDYLYINNGDKTFTESIGSFMTQSSQYTMGVDVADLNGDGYKDIFSTDMMPYDGHIKMRSGGNDTKQVADIKEQYGFLTQYARNHMQIYRPSINSYTEEALISQVFASDWSWSVLLQDFDNSGTTDIYIANGIVNRPNDLDYINYINTPSNRQREDESNEAYNQRLINQMPALKIPNLLFSQSDDGFFSGIDKSKIGTPNYSNGAAYADLDLDGDLDIISNNVNGPISLLENIGHNNQFIAISIPIKNSTVAIYYGSEKQTKEYVTTRGFQSSSTHYVHFGLGTDNLQIDSVEIITPDGSKQRYTNVETNQYIELSVDQKSFKTEYALNTHNQVRGEQFVIDVGQSDFDDLDREPLAPFYMSKINMAATPINMGNDGEFIFFIGGESGSNGQLWQYDSNSSLNKWTRLGDLQDNPIYEDEDAAVIDFNKDGHSDLYVVSGGNQYAQLDPNNQDRLYLNDGKGHFNRLPISLPHMNGSSVSVADFDRDGYEDIFVGSASIPGGYGDTPMSFILKNTEGKGFEIAYKGKVGMITDSEWVDLDEDESPELVTVGHWMSPVILDFTEDGSFRDVSSKYFPSDLAGMYNCVVTADINKDGKTDFLLGNIGSNTNWSISNNRVIELFLSDFDQNGSLDPIVFNNYFGVHQPFLDKSTIQSQVPMIRRTFSSFDDYSTVSAIDQLFPATEGKVYQTKQVKNLESVVLISTSDDLYSVYRLPQEVQLTSINDMLYLDSHKILIYGSNSDAHSHELGKSMSHGAGSLSFQFDENDLIRIKHEFINAPIGAIIKKVLQVSEKEVMLVTKDLLISYKI